MPVAAGLHYFLHEGGTVSRPSVLLVHGEGGDTLSWPSELRRLPGYRTFTLDLPGHGKSEGRGLQSVADYTASVLDFLNAAGLSRPVVAGHGLGGAIALSMADRHPERVAGIALIGTGVRLPIASALLENAANPATFPLAVQAIHSAAFGQQAERHIKETTLKRLSSLRPTLLYGDLLACDAFDLTDRLGELRLPALVVCGTEDRFTPLSYSEALASAIHAAALQTVDGAGHMVMLEQPRRLAGLLSLFLETIPYRPGM